MKNAIQLGFQLLDQKKYKEAHDHFFQSLLENKVNNLVFINTCHYGIALALIGLGYHQAAEKKLIQLKRNSPQWETPYLKLARLYEDKGEYDKAEKIYLAAKSNTTFTKKAQDAYQWFLEHHRAPITQAQPIFTPSFDAIKPSPLYLPNSANDIWHYSSTKPSHSS